MGGRGVSDKREVRLIDAISRRAVLDRLEMLRRNYGLKAGYRDAMTDAIGEVHDAPAIDAVTVVRCKDCRRWGAGYPSETDKIKCCQIAGYMIGENGYCLYAEAKDTLGV